LGALLGIMREVKLLDWEEDIDMGTLATREEFKKAEEDLFFFGWKIFDKYKGISIQDRECKTKIDIKFYQQEWDYVYAYFVVYKHRILLPICDLLIWGFRGYPAEYKYETALNRKMLEMICLILKLPPKIMRTFFLNLIEKVYYEWGLTGHKIMFPRNLILPLKVKIVNEFSYRIPAQSKEFLKLTYGDSWRKPNKIIPGTDRYEDGSSRYLTVRVMEKRPDLVEVAK